MPGLLLGVLVVAVIVAMLWDLVTLEIPDSVSAVLVAAFLGGAALGGTGWTGMLNHASAGIVVFGLGFLLHCFGAWGGGDVKLGGALALWFGWGGLPGWLFAMSLVGGVLALAILALRSRSLPAGAPAWIARLGKRDEGIPYGVALGGGALMTLGEALRFLPPA